MYLIRKLVKYYFKVLNYFFKQTEFASRTRTENVQNFDFVFALIEPDGQLSSQLLQCHYNQLILFDESRLPTLMLRELAH